MGDDSACVTALHSRLLALHTRAPTAKEHLAHALSCLHLTAGVARLQHPLTVMLRAEALLHLANLTGHNLRLHCRQGLQHATCSFLHVDRCKTCMSSQANDSWSQSPPPIRKRTAPVQAMQQKGQQEHQLLVPLHTAVAVGRNNHLGPTHDTGLYPLANATGPCNPPAHRCWSRPCGSRLPRPSSRCWCCSSWAAWWCRMPAALRM